MTLQGAGSTIYFSYGRERKTYHIPFQIFHLEPLILELKIIASFWISIKVLCLYLFIIKASSFLHFRMHAKSNRKLFCIKLKKFYEFF